MDLGGVGLCFPLLFVADVGACTHGSHIHVAMPAIVALATKQNFGRLALFWCRALAWDLSCSLCLTLGVIRVAVWP